MNSKVICIKPCIEKHISKDKIYTIKQESIDGREYLVTCDEDYVTWVGKEYFVSLG